VGPEMTMGRGWWSVRCGTLCSGLEDADAVPPLIDFGMEFLY